MRLDEYIEGLGPDEADRKRRLAEEKSYEILDYVEQVEDRFSEVTQGDSLFGSTSPSVFVGRSNYPNVSTGILSPVGEEERAADFATSSEWYEQGLDIDNVLQYRTGLLNSNHAADVDDVSDAWDGFVGTQREVAIADRPVDVEIGLSNSLELDLDVDDVTTPTGPSARATSADLAENPHVPRPVKKTLEDDDWQAQGAMTYLYRRGFDVYDINDILSAGALGRGQNRRLVPTRWSITAVDDTIGQFLRGQIRTEQSIDETQVWVNEYMGNRYWVILTPGQWEYELVEMKTPGSIWNQDPTGDTWMGSAHEGYEGRTGYVDETAGAYYASRLAVLEHLESVGRQAKCLVLREVSDDYWAPVGVWQIRESVRNAFEGEFGEAETFHGAVREIAPQLPVSLASLRRKSHMLSGLQANLANFS
ncbi:Nre family DNA repair protein [Halorussus gelatinilyticus]|uniref:DNA repair protein n=1 Tax=Halorussus gelatinilyticus TaxID=2937524 RepID=A0A8U0IGJ1_9EURY|nr:DNA repair protein NreA [Halorussus gelatinilyticus]UPV99361.1 Nre family DNA repair protein [Halorussus gelatinilyticus]